MGEIGVFVLGHIQCGNVFNSTGIELVHGYLVAVSMKERCFALFLVSSDQPIDVSGGAPQPHGGCVLVSTRVHELFDDVVLLLFIHSQADLSHFFLPRG